MSLEEYKGDLIYIASPYTHKDKSVMEVRFKEVCRVAAALCCDGHFVYSPIATSHPLMEYGVPGDWKYWSEFDELMISRCDVLAVCMMDGWDRSTGVNAELFIAKDLEMPIVYLNPEEI